MRWLTPTARVFANASNMPEERPVPSFCCFVARVAKTEHMVVRDEWRGAG